MAGSFLADDLDTMLLTAEFAVTVTRSNASTFPAIFDRAYVDPLGVSGFGPRLVCKAGVNLQHAEQLQIEGQSYRVVEPKPDGNGILAADLELL